MSKNFELEIESIIARLQPIRLEVLQAEQHFREELDHVYLGNLQSARNLVHYVSLRRHDIRELQQDLGRLALSSLGRLESHVIATLEGDPAFFEARGHDLSTEPRRRLEEGDVDAGVELFGEKPRGKQSARAPSDNRDTFHSSDSAGIQGLSVSRDYLWP
jgi:hypothetical protein